MANYAYVDNNTIQSVYDYLPANWNNISNFFALGSDESTLNSYGWFTIQQCLPEYDPSTQKLDNPSYYIQDGIVYQTMQVIDIPLPTEYQPTQAELNSLQWTVVRTQRDQMVSDFDWRILRYNRQTALGLTPQDDITALQTYMQALANVPQDNTDPFNIVWPVFQG